MNTKSYLSASGALFLIIAVFHALRIVYGWVAVIGGWVVPMWLSWAALIIAGYLAWDAWRLRK